MLFANYFQDRKKEESVIRNTSDLFPLQLNYSTIETAVKWLLLSQTKMRLKQNNDIKVDRGR